MLFPRILFHPKLLAWLFLLGNQRFFGTFWAGPNHHGIVPVLPQQLLASSLSCNFFHSLGPVGWINRLMPSRMPWLFCWTLLQLDDSGWAGPSRGKCGTLATYVNSHPRSSVCRRSDRRKPFRNAEVIFLNLLPKSH